MATFKLLALTFTIIYFFAFSTARISVPLNVLPANPDHVSKSTSKRTIFLPTDPTQDHQPSDQVISVELKPEDVDQLTKYENQEHKSSDTTAVNDLETETINHMTQSKNKRHGEFRQDFPIKEPHESDHVQEHYESDKDMPVMSENTISIETLHLNPSNYFRIRPINRHFRVKPSIFRIHQCHHHQHHMNHAFQNHHQVPYGNDMILATDDIILAGQTNERFDPSTLHISTHSSPAKKAMIHQHHHDEDANLMTRHPFRQYIAKQKLKKMVEEEIQKRKERDARKQGGFMKSFRKFLTHF